MAAVACSRSASVWLALLSTRWRRRSAADRALPASRTGPDKRREQARPWRRTRSQAPRRRAGPAAVRRAVVRRCRARLSTGQRHQRREGQRTSSLAEPFKQGRHMDLVGLVVAGQRVHHDVDAGPKGHIRAGGDRAGWSDTDSGHRRRWPRRGQIVLGDQDRRNTVAGARLADPMSPDPSSGGSRLDPERAARIATGEIGQQIESLGQHVVARHRLERAGYRARTACCGGVRLPACRRSRLLPGVRSSSSRVSNRIEPPCFI